MTVMMLTSLLVCLVMLMAWNLHPLLVALFFLVYLPLEGTFLSATLVKVPNGGAGATAALIGRNESLVLPAACISRLGSSPLSGHEGIHRHKWCGIHGWT